MVQQSTPESGNSGLKAGHELSAAYERISALESLLEECRAFIENYVDVVDGDYGVPAPNRAMSLASEIDEQLGPFPPAPVLEAFPSNAPGA